MKRALTMLVVIAYIASQLAAVPHAHGRTAEAEPSSHVERPHVHASWFDHGEHEHQHGNVRHSHDREHDEFHSMHAVADTQCGEHDCDVIYFADGAVASLSSKDSSPTGAQLALMCPAFTTPTPPTFSQAAEHWFPDNCRLGFPLYLALRALRI